MAKASNIRNLGEVMTRIRKTYEYEEQDFMMDGSGECGTMINRSWCNTRNKIVREYGFANLHHFNAVLAKRTSPRWAYFHGPGAA